MDREDLLVQVRELRAQGRTPKAVAKALGLTSAQVKPLIREAAESAQVDPAERPLIACLVNPEWHVGLSVEGEPEWLAGTIGDATEVGGPQGLVSVLVARRYKWGRVSVCGYLADVHCLGVKNALGPEIMTDAELRSFSERFFLAYPSRPITVPLDLVRHLVFGAVDYAAALGFEPHPDFTPVAPYLGEWMGPSAITFGRNGKPSYVQGPDDDTKQVLATLDRSVGPGAYDLFVEVGGFGPSS